MTQLHHIHSHMPHLRSNKPRQLRNLRDKVGFQLLQISPNVGVQLLDRLIDRDSDPVVHPAVDAQFASSFGKYVTALPLDTMRSLRLVLPSTGTMRPK